ncbi:hypothetical protein I2492_05935 [Budviciaceae bacterium CWB-B4]|uniref:Uncharacterized protein n=1 Tax=Limnobaculum xujianqingii TaxID=2738837 RepID=A0A9D7AH63_9GAMM|nr:hypothetical protein [Limnobaculum xujianqingii]MBK5072548.1 hypothetical protein [Limnobaculum xujianqingii]MBK5175857.1 hypothetical protein [Limnobaculum xujianqingii]
MLLSVVGCEFQQDGAKRIYTMTNKSVAIEHPAYPKKSQLRFYDSRGYAINKASLKQELKKAVELYKTKRGIHP